MKRIMTICTCCFMSILLLCSSILPAFAVTENTEGISVTYESAERGTCTLATSDTYTFAGGYDGCLFTVNGKPGICSWQEMYNPPDGTVTTTKYLLAQNDLRSKIFYWLLVGTDAKAVQYQAVAKAAWQNGRSSGDTVTYWAESWAHTAIDYLQQGKRIMYASEQWEAAMLSFLNVAKNWDSVPDGAKVFYYYPSGNAYQSIMSYEVQNGYVMLKKSSAKPSATEGNDNYSLEGARYCFYTNSSCSDASYIGYVTTNSDGEAFSENGSRAALRKLALGTYYVKETIPPKGYEPDETVYTVVVGETNLKNNPTRLNVTDEPKKVFAKIIKTSSKPDLTDNNPDYSMEGIQYNFYTAQDCTNDSYIGAVKLDENGIGYTKDGTRASLRNLYVGTYYIKEYFPEAIRDTVKYQLDPTVHKITLNTEFTELSPFPINLVDNPTGGGYGQINKTSSQPEITDNNSCYSLEGAVYCVYATRADAEAANTEQDAALRAIDTVTTNDLGIATFGPVDPGTYYIREKIAPPGYRKDNTVYPVTIVLDETTPLNVQDKPLNDPVVLLLQKRNATTGEIDSGEDLSGAEYTFKFYSGYYSSVEELENAVPDRTWVLRTDVLGQCMLAEDFKVSGDDFFFSTNTNVPIPVLPLGTLTIQETKTPSERMDSFGRTYGFYLDETVYLRQITENPSNLDISSYNAPTSDEYEIPNTEIKVTKLWDDGDNRDGLRPQSITVNLYRDGRPYQTAELTAGGNWTYTFQNLPTGEADFNLDEKFRPYTYTIEEISVDGYQVESSGVIPDPEHDGSYICTITNKHKPSVINISGEKQWDDSNNAMGYRPESITVNLYRDGTRIRSITTNASKNWKYSFLNLYEYMNGRKVTYTVTENPVDNYSTEINGYTITNKIKTGTVTLKKVDNSGDPLMNVGFKLFNESGKQVKCVIRNGKYEFNTLTDQDYIYYTSSTGTVKVINLPYGNYYFKEVEIPEGYMPYDKDMNVQLNDSSTSVSLTVQNNKIVLPETGGAGNIIYYIIASSFAVTAIVLFCVFFMKKKNKNKKGSIEK